MLGPATTNNVFEEYYLRQKHDGNTSSFSRMRNGMLFRMPTYGPNYPHIVIHNEKVESNPTVLETRLTRVVESGN